MDRAKYERNYLLRSDIIKDIHSARIEDGELRNRCRWFHTVTSK